MVTFRRLSPGPTVPDLIRVVADERAARWSRLTPIEIWVRPAARLLLLRERDGPPAAPAGCMPASLATALAGLRDMYHRAAAGACFAVAGFACWTPHTCCCAAAS